MSGGPKIYVYEIRFGNTGKVGDSNRCGKWRFEEETAVLFKEKAWRTEKSIIHNLLLQQNATSLRTYFTIHVQSWLNFATGFLMHPVSR